MFQRLRLRLQRGKPSPSSQHAVWFPPRLGSVLAARAGGWTRVDVGRCPDLGSQGMHTRRESLSVPVPVQVRGRGRVPEEGGLPAREAARSPSSWEKWVVCMKNPLSANNRHLARQIR